MSIVLDLPSDLLSFIDEYVAEGEAPSREQAVLDALRFAQLACQLLDDYVPSPPSDHKDAVVRAFAEPESSYEPLTAQEVMRRVRAFSNSEGRDLPEPD